MFFVQRRFRSVLSVTVLMIVLALSSAALFAGVDDLVAVTNSKGQKTGIYKKVIVSSSEVNLYRTPDGKGADPVDACAIFFRHNTADQDGYVRVATADGKPLGWIREESLISWNTRFVLKPNPPTSDGTALHVKGKDVDFKWTGTAGIGKRAYVPILEEPGKERNPKYSVALFTAVPTGKAPLSSIGGGEVPISKLQLEIMFVIDTTGSMGPVIEGAKEVVRKAAAELAAGDAEVAKAVKFGLVQYRDYGEIGKFMDHSAILETPLTNVATFQTALAGLKADGGGDFEEDVLAGLLMGIEKGGWSKNSSKHIILLGDAPAHLAKPGNTTGSNFGSIISRARKTGGTGGETGILLDSINFHAVRAGLGEVREAEIREQFQTLAGNAGAFEGAYVELDANNEKSRADAVEELTRLFSGGFRLLGTTRTRTPSTAGTGAAGSGSIGKAVWDIIASSGAGKNPEIDPVVRGTATIRSVDGDLLAQKFVQVSRDDLRRLRSTLDLLLVELSDKADPGDRGDVGQLLKKLKKALVSGTSGQQEELSEDTPLETVISSLPLKTDVLKTSVKGLAQKDKESFEKWLTGLEGAKKRADDLLEKQADEWVALHGKGENKKYAYILLQNMP